MSGAGSARGSRKMVWAGRVISALAVFPFIPSAVMKFTRPPAVIEGMAHLQLPETMILPLAILELSCVIVYLIPRVSVIGAILLTGYLGGAMLTHWRVGEPPLLHIVIGVLVWLGLWLREPRLRARLPQRLST